MRIDFFVIVILMFANMVTLLNGRLLKPWIAEYDFVLYAEVLPHRF